MNLQPWLLIRTRYVRRETRLIYRKTKISRIRYTRYLRPGTTNHPHHLGTDVTFFFPRPQHLKKTLINTICPPSISIVLLHFVLWLMAFVCTWCSYCVLFFFHLRLLLSFFLHIPGTCYLLRDIVCFFTW